MIIDILLIVVGFVLLIKGADFLVDGASDIAKKFHIPEIIIGLTIVSIGTSMPELFVSVTSIINGYADMSLGNIIGSNICNLLLILGLSAIIRNVEFKNETKKIEIPMSITLTVLFMILLNTGLGLSRKEGLLLLILFALFIGYTIFMGVYGSLDEDEEDNKKINLLKSLIYVVVGVFALKYGGDLTVDHAVNIAQRFNLSEKIISLTILAVGTSLPELVTSVTAAVKGNSDIAIGNIIGSNIFNMLLIIGLSSIISPIIYNSSYNIQMIILIVSMLLLALFPYIKPKNVMSRSNGIIFLIMYIGYLVLLFLI